MKLKKKKQNANKNGSYIALEESKEALIEKKNQNAVHGNENGELVSEVRIKIYLKVLSIFGNLLRSQPQCCKSSYFGERVLRRRSMSREPSQMNIYISSWALSFTELIL